MKPRLRWGILGTGNIASQFCNDVGGGQRSELVAVASRERTRAEQFAASMRIPRAETYEQLLADPAVEAVYISLPNALHHEWTIKALLAGKHVLCEKPLASNAAQACEMFDVANRAGRVLVEAFMYRSHPLTLAVLQQVRDGAIGQVRMIRGSFCYCTKKWQGNIRFDAALAGGGLMDVGCYCVNFSRLVAGTEPTNIHACGRLHASGVDEMAAATMTFPGADGGVGVVASFTCGMTVHAGNPLQICGSDGFIEVPWPWKPPMKGAEYVLSRSIPPRMDGGTAASGPQRQIVAVDAPLPLFGLEADDFVATVRDGAPPRITREDSLGNMRVLDEMRRQIGVKMSNF